MDKIKVYKLNADEISCPVCGYPGKEKMTEEKIRIYHPGRETPCLAPEGYKPQQETKDQLA